MTHLKRRTYRFIPVALILIGLTACGKIGGRFAPEDQVTAPGVDIDALAAQKGASNVEVGHRLISAGEYELAIRSFNRAALERGTLDAEILSGLGTANLGMGRLGEAEKLLARAVEQDDAQPVDYNNYAVLLMEKGRTGEAIAYFKRGFALSNGENIAIRDNLRLALAKSENSVTVEEEKKRSDYKLVRRGNSDFVIRPTP